MQCFDDTFDAYSTHVELKISGWKQDIQQLFNVMDDGRKGYVSGADLMTLQAVDAANLSENDLQAGPFFPGFPNRRRKVPIILKRWDQVKFEIKVVGIGTPKKKRLSHLMVYSFSELSLDWPFTSYSEYFNLVKAAKVEKQNQHPIISEVQP